MALNLNSILIGTDDAEKLAKFYRGVIGKDPDMAEGGFYGWLVGVGFMSIIPHSKVHGASANPERMMFNFETAQVKEEFDRIKGLGAKVIREPSEEGGMWIATLADPDGNYFQLVSPWNNQK